MSEAEYGTDSGQAASPTSVGQLLRAARERANLSAADVARQLRLGLRQIEALEADDFAALPGNTIVRGFIRNYAKLLQLDAGPFLAAYESASPGGRAETIAMTAANIDISPRASRRWLAYLAAAVLVVVGVPVLIYALLGDDGMPAANGPRAGGQHPAPSAAPPAPPAALPVAPAPTAPAQTPAADSNAPMPAPAQSVSGASRGPATPVIQMRFDEDAWVEVRDRSGQKIFSQLNRAGTEQTLTGEGPFTLVIGNAAKVHLTYNGKPVALQPYIRINVARLTLE